MNRYGRLALDHNRRYRPAAYSQIPNPRLFFAAAGEKIQDQVSSLRDDLLADRRPDETIEDYRLRSYQALATAEEMVLADHYLFQTEPSEEPATDSDDPDLGRYCRHLAEINQAIHDPL